MRKLIVLRAIRVYHSCNKGIVFDLSGVPTYDWWLMMEFLRRYSFLVDEIQVQDADATTEARP